MTHQEKVEHLIAELSKKGMNASMVAPPIFRLLWALGIRVPPPLFLSFHTLVLMISPFFGILWGGGMWLFMWQGGKLSLEIAILASAIAGVFFGLIMAGCYRWKAKQLNLPSWEDYPEATKRELRDYIDSIVKRTE
jgi:hypothetical protein